MKIVRNIRQILNSTSITRWKNFSSS